MTNTKHIPDEAVKAALDTWMPVATIDNDLFEDMRKTIAAALPHLSAPCAVEVIKLDWSIPFPHETQERAESVFGTYAIWEIGGEGYYRTPSATAGTPVQGGQTEAKAAAQADFERRILSCVVTKPVDVPALLHEVRNGERDGFINTGKEPNGNDADLSCPCCGGSGHKDDAKPVDVAAVRRQGYREGLEAAAKWHDEHAIGYETEYSNLNIADEMAAEHRGSATAIRALSAEPAQAEQRRPIETAPKDGTEILAWREDCGWLIVSYTSLDAFPMSQSELDELDEETLFQKDWFTQFGQHRLEGNEVPTHWMPLPAAPTPEAGK